MPALQTARAARAAGAVVVPMSIVESGGHLRPTVEARFNGHTIRMMIHSNADFYSQLRQHQATSFGVRKTGVHASYGIDRGGHVSGLGLDRGTVATLAVGRHVNRNAPVSIFEVPQDEYGMLGIAWIRQNHVIIDYRRKQAIISAESTAAASIARSLVREGYSMLPLKYDVSKKRFVIRASINGVTRQMTVATASSFTIDTAFADAAKLKHGADRGHGSGPSGTRVADYALAEPVQVKIGQWISPPISSGDVTDEYGYLGSPRPNNAAEADGGELGGDFLMKTEAVIDFGNGRLFVRNGGR